MTPSRVAIDYDLICSEKSDSQNDVSGQLASYQPPPTMKLDVLTTAE